MLNRPLRARRVKPKRVSLNVSMLSLTIQGKGDKEETTVSRMLRDTTLEAVARAQEIIAYKRVKVRIYLLSSSGRKPLLLKTVWRDWRGKVKMK